MAPQTPRTPRAPHPGRPAGLFVLLLLLLAGVPRPLAAQEVANVMVGGEPVLTVAGAGDTSAVVRARRVGERLRERLATDAPLAPLRVVPADTGALILAAGDTLLRVSLRDAEVALARPLEPGEAPAATRRVAREWAEALGALFARVAAEERERVVVQGLPLFEVGGTPELRAARRAAAIGVRVGELAAAPGELPAVRAVPRGRGAAVVAGGRVLVEVSPEEARARGTAPLELAEEWAEEIRRVVGTVRAERTGAVSLRVAGLVLLAVLAAWALHWLLRRASRRLAERQRAEEARHGFGMVVARWGLSLLRLAVWIALAVCVLWLVPRTRPFVYLAGDRTLEAVGRAAGWAASEGLVVALIVVTTFLIARFAGEVVRHLVLAYGARRGGRIALRADTLSGTVAAGAQLLVLFLGLLSVLAQMDVDPVPLLASAGVAGIAIGFGVQTLIRDFFTGFFILLEDQYGVGDVIRVAGNTGKVERLTLRITQIRGIDGSLTSIPNGEILTVTNLSKDWAQVVLDVHVDLEEDVDRATAVISRTAGELADDWPDRVRGEPEVLGVEAVDPATRTITIRVIIRTAPLEQWAVSREMRRRIVDVFEKEGIRVPPRSVVALSNDAGKAMP